MNQSTKDNGKSTEMIQGEEPLILERKTFQIPMSVGERGINAHVDPGSEECLVRKDLIADSDIKPTKIKTATLFDGTEVGLFTH